MGLVTRRERTVRTTEREGLGLRLGCSVPLPSPLSSRPSAPCDARRGEGKKEAKEKRLSHASADNEFSWFSSGRSFSVASGAVRGWSVIEAAEQMWLPQLRRSFSPVVTRREHCTGRFDALSEGRSCRDLT